MAQVNLNTIEVKEFKQRVWIAAAFSTGFAIGIITIRPFFV